MTLSRIQKRIVLIIGTGLLLFISWLAVTGVQAKHHLINAQTSLQAVHLSDVLNQPKDVYATLTSATDEVAKADRLLKSPGWSVVANVPIAGRSVKALRTTTSNLYGVMRATTFATRGLKTFVHDPKQLIDPGLIKLALATIGALDGPLHKTVNALEALDLRMVPGSVSDPIAKIEADLRQALPFIEQGQSLVSVAPLLLGLDKPHTWLMVMGNGAEARSTGGFPGGLSLLRINQGNLQLLHQESNNGIFEMRLNNWQSQVPPEVASFYGDDLSRFPDVNLSPDFPTNGKFMAAMYEQYSGQKVSGVLFCDEHTLAGLMQLTGPVEFRGRTFTSDNIRAYIGKGVYADYADNNLKDQALIGLSKKIFYTLSTMRPDLLTTAKTFLALIAQGRLHAWSSDPAEQRSLVRSPAGGSMNGPHSPKHAVVFVNGAGNKIDAYIHTSVKYVQGRCEAEFPYRTSTLDISMRNTAPESGLPRYVEGRLDISPSTPGKGSTKMLTYVHVPLNSSLLAATYDGKPANLHATGTENERSVWRFDNVIGADRQKLLHLKFIEFADPANRPELLPQPMANDTKITIKRGPTCQ
jgi:Protein of unknown function (DUF4012)